MTRQEAQQKLKSIFGFDDFFDNQWITIERLFKGERVLLIEKTGFGKSLCYQFPAIQFDGTTIVFSPLIALMRDQVNKLKSIGIKAESINSNQTVDENNKIIDEAKNNRIKLLYIAPERMENVEWLQSAREMQISMVVVDEAHCISVWGHDFRPAFKRIVNLVNLLPKHFPVLATTATATKRVEEDIKKQIGGDITSIRGGLLRPNLRLFVFTVKSEDEKMAWIGENINKIQGTGIIYCGRRADTEIYSRWLEFLGINSVSYNSGLDAESRKAIEQGLLDNSYKCVISTNALGMGIDKPDIRFIIHTQMPASPIHYYQEIGRAGRDGQQSYIILFFNPDSDLDLPKNFIEGGRPSTAKYTRVIEALRTERLGLNQLIKKVNLKQTEVNVIKSDLIEQNIISEVVDGRSKVYELNYNAKDLDKKAFDDLREHKLRELDEIVEYVNTKDCRMKFLCNYLGDDFSQKCHKCDNEIKRKFSVDMKPEWELKLSEFKGDFFPILDVARSRNILINGVASSYYGLSNVGKMIHKCKYENGGDYPDFLIKSTISAFRKHFGNEKFDLMLYVPPTESGDLVKNFASNLAKTLNIPISHNLTKKGNTSPQKIFQTALLKTENVKNAFTYTPESDIEGKSILLIDDIYDSGATIREIGKLLGKLGAIKVAPLAIAKTVGGDIVEQ